MWGGKRKGAGRGGKGDERDWNKYKSKAKRKKLVEASKSSMDIKSFFSSSTKNSSEITEDLNSNSLGQSMKENTQKMFNKEVKQKEDMTQSSVKDCVMEEEKTRQNMPNKVKQKEDITQSSVKDCVMEEEETMQMMPNKVKQKEDMTHMRIPLRIF